MPCKQSDILTHLTMAKPAAFLVLLMYTCSTYVLLSWGDFWSPGTLLSSHSWSAQLSGVRILFTATCWHTNNQSNTTTACRHVPKKHICKKPILPTSTIKMEGGRSVLQGYHIKGRAISHLSQCLHHSTQPMEELVPLPKHPCFFRRNIIFAQR